MKFMKQFGVGALIGCLVITSAGAAENKLQDAFSSMTNSGYTDVQGMKRYNGTMRSGVDFGSGRIVSGASTSNISLLNITPPQATAGCSGIDWHLGGISWINWDQFSALLDSVLMAAQYAVVNMALDWISEKLGSVFKAVMNALQEATKMELDSCKLGKQLADKAVSGAKSAMSDLDFGEGLCNESAQKDNISDSFGMAGIFCTDYSKVVEHKMKELQDWAYDTTLGKLIMPDGTTPTKPTGDRAVDRPKGVCVGTNCTWRTLRGAGFAPTYAMASIDAAAASSDVRVYNYLAGTAFSELLMSGTGYRMGPGADAGTADPSGAQPRGDANANKAGTLTNEAFVAIFMCGLTYINAANEAAIATDAATNGDKAGDADIKQQLMVSSIKQIKSVCETVQKLGSGSGSNVEQIKILTCMPQAKAAEYAKAEGDNSGVNDSALVGFTGPLAAEMKAAKDECKFPVAIPIKTWANQDYVKNTFLSEGLLTRNMRIMQSIFAKLIRGNERLETEEIAFIQSAPAPVYQMLSMAALFPTQGMEIVQSEALLISVLQTEAFIDRLVNDASKTSDLTLAVYPEDLDKIMMYLANTSKVYGRVNVNVDAQLNRAAAFQAQVKVLQTAVMDSIYGNGLMGNMTFSADIVTAAPPP